MNEPTVSDRREALRAALTLVRLSARGDTDGMIQIVSTMGQFELGTAIGCLAQLAVTGVAGLAGGAAISFGEMLVRLEEEMVLAADDGE